MYVEPPTAAIVDGIGKTLISFAEDIALCINKAFGVRAVSMYLAKPGNQSRNSDSSFLNILNTGDNGHLLG